MGALAVYRVIIVKYDLLVDSRSNEVVIALLKDKQLIELIKSHTIAVMLLETYTWVKLKKWFLGSTPALLM